MLFRSPQFCTHWQLDNDRSGCDSLYKGRTQCDKQILKNGCLHNLVYDEKSSCENPNNSKSVFEYYGPGSRCFRASQGYSSLCLRNKVVDNKLFVIIGKKEFECKKSNQVIEFEFDKPDGKTYISNFRCPDLKDFINKSKIKSCPSFCYFNGMCINGKCECFNGYDPRTHCRIELAGADIGGTSFFNALK